MNSNKICELQNKRDLLKIQYAARKSFNAAECNNYYSWLMCFLAQICIILPEKLPIYIILGLPFVIDIMGAYFTFSSNKKVMWASKLRRFFDCNVLHIREDLVGESEIRIIKEYVENIYCKNIQEAEEQMSNNGSDTPPGVKDWYVFQRELDGLDAVFECQKQNIWWNKKMISKRVVFCIIEVIVLGLVTYLLFSYNGVIKTVLCSGCLLLKVCNRIYQNYQYIKVSNQIDGSVKTIENNLSIHGIEILQDLIDERRTINVLEIGAVHKRMAKKWTELYNKIVD